jgi:hypothetical protein
LRPPLIGGAEHRSWSGDIEELAAVIGQDEDAMLGHWQKIDLFCHFCQCDPR